MLKPIVKSFALAFSSIAAVLSVCQSASAQLNIGRYGVQPGLEYNYLQYQLSGQDLGQMRGIPGCGVGFGLGCNKTGSVVQQLLESNNGPSYDNLLMRAAGGPENFQNFANFYGNNPYLADVPYASFWQNDSPYIMDGYRYLLGGQVSRTPVENLGLVTNNFYWSPLSPGANNSLSPRSGLLNLKYSYGRLLFEEARNIPNFEQQIRSLNLPQNIENYYLSTYTKGVLALNSGNEAQLQQSILELLSAPYSETPGVIGRPIVGVPNEFNQILGQGLSGDEVVGIGGPVGLEGDALSFDVPAGGGEVFLAPAGSGFPILPVLGGLAALGLLLALIGGGGDDSSSGVVPPGDIIGGGGGQELPPPPPVGGGNPPPPEITGPGIEIPPPGIGGPGGPTVDVEKVPEPSVMKAVVLLIIVMYLFGRKQWRAQTKN
ncbi:hypothetical protein [Iningainema tapete]|uniref:Uncharacterized protein n=1 Tax=Iningainema tapete BLCC-T55 TaxID=2748662 RepID=A0A8J7C8B7_9CYAN|nr:hypothetical protein [Iningainema tapete]MBD2776744.1 hypothetical protein [Iningainema tapete BLCC-T55]